MCGPLSAAILWFACMYHHKLVLFSKLDFPDWYVLLNDFYDVTVGTDPHTVFTLLKPPKFGKLHNSSSPGYFVYCDHNYEDDYEVDGDNDTTEPLIRQTVLSDIWSQRIVDLINAEAVYKAKIKSVKDEAKRQLAKREAAADSPPPPLPLPSCISFKSGLAAPKVNVTNTPWTPPLPSRSLDPPHHHHMDTDDEANDTDDYN